MPIHAKAVGAILRLRDTVTAKMARPGLAVETSRFEEWDDRGRCFDLIVAAASWHCVDPVVGWRRAHDLLRSGGWIALLNSIVVRRPGEPEAYAETADLHEQFSPGNPDWGHPPVEDEVRRTDEGWGLVADPGDLFGPTTCAGTRWCSGSTATGSPTSSAPSPPIAPWTLMSVTRC
jgi:SAM-dependent methyltransferase